MPSPGELMELTHRQVTSIPLRELWDGSGVLSASRHRDIGAEKLRELIRLGPVRFVVADLGSPLRWIAPKDRFSFWKSEVRPHLAEPEQHVWLDSFPDSYCYFGSEWRDASDVPIVALVRSH